MRCAAALVLTFATPFASAAQQVADTTFRPPVARPAFAAGRGPVVAIDEGHVNFHTVTGRFSAFASLVRRDGFVVRAHAGPFTAQSLRDVAVLVIANPLHPSDHGRWVVPNPSAFSDEEIAVVRAWVERGGALLLIADHMPFAGAAERLGAAFGVAFTNGFAYDSLRGDPTRFRRADGGLADHPITRGRSAAERIDSVATFTGSAFRAPADAAPLFTFSDAAYSLNPAVAWRFDSATTRVPIGRWHQGAALGVGRGRVVIMGEAAMFTAQLAGAQQRRMGMSHAAAPQNAAFVLNVVRWLAGVLQQGT